MNKEKITKYLLKNKNILLPPKTLERIELKDLPNLVKDFTKTNKHIKKFEWADIITWDKKNGYPFLRKLFNFRSEFIQKLMIYCYNLLLHDGIRNPIIALHLGSTTVESDMDITVHGIYSDIIIKMFHKFFKKIWNTDPETVFDVDIIAGGFYRPICVLIFIKQ